MTEEGDPGERTRSAFSVPKMDCPGEVGMIRMALDGDAGLELAAVDLDKREIEVLHPGSSSAVLDKLSPLGLGVTLLGERAEAEGAPGAARAHLGGEREVLRQVLAINLAMFVVEMLAGWYAESTGLLADSLDMLADASVYLVSWLAVGRGGRQQHRAAMLAGAMQMLLGVGVLGEVLRRALVGSEPVSLVMMLVASLALAANLWCVQLLMPHREGGAHMAASWIFTTADALANLGVILAGALVIATGSAIPDLVIGAGIALVVLRSAWRIFRLPRSS